MADNINRTSLLLDFAVSPIAPTRENDKLFSLRSRKGFGSHIFGPDRLIGYNALSYIAECVQTARAHVHYLGLVQTSQGLQEVAEIAADAVEVLEWSGQRLQ